MTYTYGNGRTQEAVYDDLHRGTTYTHHPQLPRGHGTGMEQYIIGYSSIYDVGCGRCEWLKYCKFSLGMKRVAGCDISGVAVDFQLRQNGVSCMQSDLTEGLLLPDDAYEVVTCFDVIEHLPEETIPFCLNELGRVCQKRLILSICYKPALMGRDSEPLHLTVKDARWWRERLFNAFACEPQEVHVPGFSDPRFIIDMPHNGTSSPDY